VIFARSRVRGSLRQGSSRPLGSGEAVEKADVEARLAILGADGDLARQLDQAAEQTMRTLRALSDLTVPLALAYLDRIARPLQALDLESAVRLTTRGYAAHLAVEERGRDLGVEEVPVLGHLPPIRHGRPSQGLLTQIVKLTRRGFDAIRAVTAPTWDGLVVITAGRLHAGRRKGPDGTLPPPLDVEVIDALLRFGWVLRQVDLFYGFQPDRS
jgi:hypothetical protein